MFLLRWAFNHKHSCAISMKISVVGKLLVYDFSVFCQIVSKMKHFKGKGEWGGVMGRTASAVGGAQLINSGTKEEDVWKTGGGGGGFESGGATQTELWLIVCVVEESIFYRAGPRRMLLGTGNIYCLDGLLASFDERSADNEIRLERYNGKKLLRFPCCRLLLILRFESRLLERLGRERVLGLGK